MNIKSALVIAVMAMPATQSSGQVIYEPSAIQPAAVAQSYHPFKHLDLGVELGTTGMGLQLSSPVTPWARLRTGFTYMPAFDVHMKFDIQMLSKNPLMSKSYFDKMSQLVYDNFGMQVKDNVEMIGTPSSFWNWNVIVDFYPLKNNKHWHISGGFYLGSARIAKAYNTTEDMQSLLAVNIYNTMYSKFINDRTAYYMDETSDHYLPEIIGEIRLFDLSAMGDAYEGLSNDPAMLKRLYNAFASAGQMGVQLGKYKNDVLYPEDVYITIDDDGDGIAETPVMVHQKGDVLHKAGDPYIMKPDATGMVKADMHVNRFKPYVGIGYEGNLSKKSDRWKIAVDGGVLFWGGSPSVTTHEGVDLVHDVENIGGKVGSYVEAIDKFRVWPMLSAKITYRLF